MLPNFPVICHGAPESLSNMEGFATSGGTWVAANRAIFIPFSIDYPMVVAKMGWINGAAVSGNVDVGIYTVKGTLLASSGSTAQAGTNSLQTVSVSVTLAPGAYFMAMAMDNTTGTQSRLSSSVNILRTTGVKTLATAFPLPADASALTVHAYNYCPALAVASRSFV